MRERRAGVIVNVSSSVTLRSLPLLSVYMGSKAAVNAFYRVARAGAGAVRRRRAAGGAGRAPDTSFGENARSRMENGFPGAYSDLVAPVPWRLPGNDDAAPTA